MIPLDAEVYVALEPIDLRVSFDKLAGWVRERFGADPKDGTVYVFFGKRGEKLKALFYDKTGYCILYKRLCRGTFRIPTSDGLVEKTIRLPEEVFLGLLEGLGGDSKKPRQPRQKKTPGIH